MSRWDSEGPPVLLPNPPNADLPGAGGFPLQGLWSPRGEGNPLLWHLVSLLADGGKRQVPAASRRNIVDARGVPLRKNPVASDARWLSLVDAILANTHRDSPSGPTALALLQRWFQKPARGAKKKREG